MKRLITLILVLSFIIVGISSPALAESKDVKAVVKGNNEFAVAIYKKLCSGKKGNLFLSPYSISTALAMTYGGARGNTEIQMAKVLHFTLPQNKLHPAYGSLIHGLNERGKKGDYKLTVANRLWAQEGYKFLNSFLVLTEKYYGAGLQLLDFQNALEKSRVTINTWIEKKTNGKIVDLIKRGAVNKMTRLVLTNAIYFKGEWQDKFMKEATTKADFHVSAKNKIKVNMMRKVEHFKFAKCKGFKVVEMPYKGRDISMIVFLPDKIDGINSLEKSMNAGNLDKWISKLKYERLRLSFPKFKVTSSFLLGKALKGMGMLLPFSGDADFSGMTKQETVFISEVIHKTFVKVDEAGTEAAAATAVIMAGSAAPSKEPEVFNVNRPFVFMIRDNKSGSILFMGRVMKPDPAK
ncbi:MAG: serpin family protein [Candidatus Eremiobacteraeota bacterium]|nr:serpin family protein [Candidatus Eremiobacteraeota bacterium]